METPITYPPALYKACWDSFDYAMRLRTGETWLFAEARPINAEWVEITLLQDRDSCHQERWAAVGHPESPRPPFPRGVEVRVSDIVWIADAPFGS